MINDYKNSNDILRDKTRIADWVKSEDRDLLKTVEVYSNFGSTEYRLQDTVEAHIYDLQGNWLSGNHRVDNWKLENSSYDNSTANTRNIFVDVDANFRSLGFERGEYRFVYNFNRNWVGDYNRRLFVKEILANRTELILSLGDPNDEFAKAELDRFFLLKKGIEEYKELIQNPPDDYWRGHAAAVEAKFRAQPFNRYTREYERPYDDILRDYIDDTFLDKNTLQSDNPNNPYFNIYAVNFGLNNIVRIINAARIDENDLIVKLYEPAPDFISQKILCWLFEEVHKPYTDKVIIYGKDIVSDFNVLGQPNFNLDVDDSSIETDFKTWNDLLGSELQTSQQIIDNYFSGSLTGIKLNIDYSNFKNFIHYSSATERIFNFKSKLETIEFYNARLKVLGTVSGSTAGNIISTIKNRNAIISGFDDFEKYLYFQSGSQHNFTYQTYPLADEDLQYSEWVPYIKPWPKQPILNTSYTSITWLEAYQQWANANFLWNATSSVSYSYGTGSAVLMSVTSSEAIAYFEDLVQKADEYDRLNESTLVKTIPEFIRMDVLNQDYELFVNMIGHHFDILWTYIDHLSSINNRFENPKTHKNIPDDLLYDVAKSMGVNLINGNQSTDLWNYSARTYEVGPIDPLKPKTREEHTKEVWRRIVNNIPYLLKTKGTSRAVKAIASAYGVPSTILAIKEYGGPKNTDSKPAYIYDQFDYALQLDGTNSNYVKTLWDKIYDVNTSTFKFPDTIELRFRNHEDGKFDYDTRPLQTLLQIGPNPSLFVTLEKVSGRDGYADITLYLSGSAGYRSASLQDQYLLDGDFNSLMIRRTNSTDSATVNNRYELVLGKEKYGTVTIFSSASIQVSGALNIIEQSYNRTWAKKRDLYLGYASNNITSNSFTGSVQELRYWNVPLNDESFRSHIIAYTSYVGNNPTSSYDDLVFRLPLRDKLNLTIISSSVSAHPNQNISTFATASYPLTSSFVGAWSGNVWDYWEDTQYLPTPQLGTNNLTSDKIRIEDNYLLGELNTQASVEYSEYDWEPFDSNRLGVYFSPQEIINRDIFQQIGAIDLDDYIGDPRNLQKSNYPELNQLAWAYWKKYTNVNDVAAYVRLFSLFDFSMFKQIKQFLPGRANQIVGLVIEPNALERNRLATKPVKKEEPFWDGIIDETAYIIESEVSDNTGIIEIDDELVKGDISNNEGVITNTQVEVDATYSRLESLIDADTLTLESEVFNDALEYTNNTSNALRERGTDNTLNTLDTRPNIDAEQLSPDLVGSMIMINTIESTVEDSVAPVFTVTKGVEPSRYELISIIYDYNWRVQSSSQWITASNPYWEKDAVMVSVMNSTKSYIYSQPTYVDFIGTGYRYTNGAAGDSNDDTFINLQNITGSADGKFAGVSGSIAGNTEIITLNKFGFRVPKLVDIWGFSVKIKARTNIANTVRISAIYFSRNSNPITAVTGSSFTTIEGQKYISTRLSDIEYNTRGFLGGQTWTVDEINSDEFSVRLILDNTAPGTLTKIDSVEVNVEYRLKGLGNMAEVQDTIPIGVKNQRYLGCKLTATDINARSKDTVDGGPVIEVIKVNPNKLVYSNSRNKKR